MAEIIYKEKALPLYFGMHAINEFTKHSKVDFDSAVTSTSTLSSLDSIVAVAVAGLNDGARRSGEKVRYKECDVWEMFDEDPTLIFSISELFMEAVVPMVDKLGDIGKNLTPTAE